MNGWNPWIASRLTNFMFRFDTCWKVDVPYIYCIYDFHVKTASNVRLWLLHFKVKSWMYLFIITKRAVVTPRVNEVLITVDYQNVVRPRRMVPAHRCIQMEIRTVPLYLIRVTRNIAIDKINKVSSLWCRALWSMVLTCNGISSGVNSVYWHDWLSRAFVERARLQLHRCSCRSCQIIWQLKGICAIACFSC